MQPDHRFFDSYCYGPVDLLKLRKGDSTMWLSLRDSAGRSSEAVYSGCVYWQLEHSGIHFSLVRRVSAAELLRQSDSPAVQELQKNACDISGLLQSWEAEGLSFFLHIATHPEGEFLVVARYLEYREAP